MLAVHVTDCCLGGLGGSRFVELLRHVLRCCLHFERRWWNVSGRREVSSAIPMDGNGMYDCEIIHESSLRLLPGAFES